MLNIFSLGCCFPFAPEGNVKGMLLGACLECIYEKELPFILRANFLVSIWKIPRI